MLAPTRTDARPMRQRGGVLVPVLLLLGAFATAFAPWARRAEEARHHDAVAAPGERASLDFDAIAPSIPGRLDVAIVLDQSSSYSDDLSSLRSQVPTLAMGLKAKSDLQFGFFGFDDAPGDFTVHLPLGADFSGLSSMLASLRADGDGDGEIWLHAIEQVALGQPFRPNATKVIVLATDEPSEVVGRTDVDQVVDLLNQNGIRLVALIPRNETLPQADRLAAGVDGVIQDVATDSSDIEQAITQGLRSLPVDIVPRLVSDDSCPIKPGSEEFSPPMVSGVDGGSENPFRVDFEAAESSTNGLYDCTIDLGERSRPFVLRVRRSNS